MVLFLEKVKVRIFRKNAIFFKNSKLRISERTESSGSLKWTFEMLQSSAYTKRVKKPLIEVQKMCTKHHKNL